MTTFEWYLGLAYLLSILAGVLIFAYNFNRKMRKMEREEKEWLNKHKFK